MPLLLRRFYTFFFSYYVAAVVVELRRMLVLPRRSSVPAAAAPLLFFFFTLLLCRCFCSRIEAHAGVTTPLHCFCASSVVHVLLCRCCCMVDFILLLVLSCCCSLWLRVASHERKKNVSRRHFRNALLTRTRYLNSYWVTRLSFWGRPSSRTIVTPLGLFWTAMKA